jgi:outer membrane protein assembly factor BamB
VLCNHQKFIATMSRLLKKMLLPFLCAVAATSVLVAGSAEATYFRSADGVAESGAGPLPDDFAAAGESHWRVPLDPGHSTPVLCSGRVFVTGYRVGSKELATIALDQKTGQTLWRRAMTSPAGRPATSSFARRISEYFRDKIRQ